jgi:hypothetical protein
MSEQFPILEEWHRTCIGKRVRQASFLLLFALCGSGSFVYAQATIESPTVVVENSAAYKPITAEQRLAWFGRSTVGVRTLAAGMITAALGTWMDEPEEYGPHWSGYGQRYGMRLTGIAASNAMEVGIGSIWGEDPRYARTAAGTPFKGRVGHAIKWTFITRDRDGGVRPAYARYIAYSGSNFLSNTWRADSEADTSHALTRTLEAFLGEMGSNAFIEFWPDFRRRVLHRKAHD